MPSGFKEAYRQFVAAGWGSIDGPGAYGGQDLPFTLATVVIEALGSANMGFSLCSILTPGAIHALMAYGTEEQRQTWLPKLVTGEWNGTMNLTEPAAGSDVGALRSTAEKVAEGPNRSEEHTSELQSLMRISYAVFCLKKTTHVNHTTQ